MRVYDALTPGGYSKVALPCLHSQHRHRGMILE
jgi:hypothetical protein